MTFPQLIQEKLCHDFQMIECRSGPSLHCKICNGIPIPNVYDFIENVKDDYQSCLLAQAYYNWTGDDNVPVKFLFVGLNGIMDNRIKGQTMRHLCETIDVLKAVNAPFLHENHQSPISMKTYQIMENFVKTYLESIASPSFDNELDSNEKTLIMNLVGNLHKLLECKEFPNIFQMYFEKLVPYVQSCHENWTPLQLGPIENKTLIEELLWQFKISEKIRQEFSTFSLPFEIIHVLIGCYASSSDIKVVANWALDLMSRFCKGQFLCKTSKYFKYVDTICRKSISYKNNTKINYLLQDIRKGEGIESLSTNLKQYAEAEKIVRDKVSKIYSDVDIITSHLFPTVLFDDVAYYAGFIIGLAQIVGNMDFNTKLVAKGTFYKARTIHNFIVSFINRVRNFDSIPMCWTVETLRMFTAQDPTFQDDALELVRMVLRDDLTE